MAPKRVYSFMIDEDLASALKTVKERDGIPEGEQIRRALKAWFLEKRVMKKKSDRPHAPTRKRS